MHGDMRPPRGGPLLSRSPGSVRRPATVVLATGRYVGEGFDDPRLDTLLLAMPIAWKGTVVQPVRNHKPRAKYDSPPIRGPFT
jgi:hypothetical protein